MADCPKCGNKIQARKMLWLTNLNSITCQVCSSKLRVKNKDVNSAIGGAGGAIGTVFISILIILFAQTGNFVYLGLVVVWFTAVFFVAGLLVLKFVKLQLVDNTNF